VEDGRGAIIIGAHYGPRISARLFKEHGMETRALVSERTVKHLMDASKYGVRFLKTRKLAFTTGGSLLVQSRRSEKTLVKHVISGGAIMMLMDFPAASAGGELVEFLGSPFKFNTFAFKLALRHSVPVFFFFLVRQGRDSFRLSVAPCEGFSTPEEGLRIYKTRLESVILENPFEWAFSQRYCRWLEQMRKPS
jgi:lauroyl/myristoyl acyltransferase